MQSFIMNSHEVFIHIHQGCFAGTGAIVRLPQCQWSKPDGYGKISQCITTTKHSKAKTVCIFLGIYCRSFQAEHHVNSLEKLTKKHPIAHMRGWAIGHLLLVHMLILTPTKELISLTSQMTRCSKCHRVIYSAQSYGPQSWGLGITSWGLNP